MTEETETPDPKAFEPLSLSSPTFLSGFGKALRSPLYLSRAVMLRLPAREPTELSCGPVHAPPA
jgi:hypothetical protein